MSRKASFAVVFGGLICATLTMAADAATVFSENFAGANAGTQPIGPISGTKFTSSGADVDIVGQTANGGHFFDCIGNAGGACIDLVGDQGPGSTITSTAIALTAGDTYSIAFSDILQGFSAGDPQVSAFTVSLGSFTANLVSLAGITTSRSLSFVAATADPLATLSFHTTTAPDSSHGPVVQNITVSETSPAMGAVPEPASWSMMIFGFGVVGAGMRYRQRRTNLSFVRS